MTLQELEEQTSSHFLFIYNNINLQESAIIDPDMVEIVEKQLQQMNQYKALTLVLNTRGGNLASGYKIINMIKEKFPRLDVIILGRCGSTGTFMALAADSLYVSRSALITPTEPQMDTCDGTSQNISTSVIRNFLENSKRYSQSVEKLNPITYGNYYATISYFKDLCYNTYDETRAQKIIEFMLNQVNSHQMPLNREDFRRIGIELLDIPSEMMPFLEDQHHRMIEYLNSKTTKNKRHTLIRNSQKTYVYEKKYDNDKHKIAEGYFAIEEEGFMEKSKNQANGRIADIMTEGVNTSPSTYKDAYSDKHWDSYNDSRYHDYGDHSKYYDYGDNSTYHDHYIDGLQMDEPKVKTKSPKRGN